MAIQKHQRSDLRVCEYCGKATLQSEAACNSCGANLPPPSDGEPTADELEKIDEYLKAEDHANEALAILDQIDMELEEEGYRNTEAAKEGLEYIDWCVSRYPEVADYWGIKGLLLWAGMGDKDGALQCIDKALSIEPDNVTFKQDRRAIESDSASGGLGSKCFVATVAFQDPEAWQVETLRQFRDRCLAKTRAGSAFVVWYYQNGPAIAECVSRHFLLRQFSRITLTVFSLLLRIAGF